MPQYDDWRKREALRALGDAENLRCMLTGMISRERLRAYEEVAEEIGVDDEQRRMLREHRTFLNERNSDHDEAEEEFRPASERADTTADTVEPVADGGAEVVDDSGDEYAPGDGQAVQEYDDDYEDELRNARSLAERYESVDEIEAALQRETERETWRPHVAQALRERREVLTA